MAGRGHLLMALALLTTLAPASLATASDSQRREARSTVRFSSPFRDPGTRISQLDGCTVTQPGLCSFSFHGEGGRFSGALSTVADYHGHGYFDPSATSLSAESWDHHVGSLRGCGRGSFVMHQTDFRTGPTNIDVGHQALRATLKWTLVPRSGTGSFSGATGSGTATVYFNSAGFSDGEPYIPNFGTYTGAITCAKHWRSR